MGVTFVRTAVMYLSLMGAMRLMGKRQIGQLEPSELVVAMMIADLSTIPLQDLQAPLYRGLIPVATVLALELLFAFLSLRSLTWRRLLCGTPVILIDNGKILQANLRATRLTLDELTGHLRQKEILDISRVQYAILETDGNLSVFPFPEQKPASAAEAGIDVAPQRLPIPLISDGKLLKENLRKSGKDLVWLEKQLRHYKATVNTTWLLSVDSDQQVTFYPKQL